MNSKRFKNHQHGGMGVMWEPNVLTFLINKWLYIACLLQKNKRQKNQESSLLQQDFMWENISIDR